MVSLNDAIISTLLIFIVNDCPSLSGAYLDLLLGRATQVFSLIQAQNVQFLVIFKSGESLIFVIFF
jgi:hypothetical protein